MSGGVWLGCIVSTVGGGLCARVWGGSVVGYRLVAGIGASLWVGLPRCPLGASRGRPCRLAEGGFWGVPHPWGHHCVLACRSCGLGVASVSSVWLVAARRVSSSAAPNGDLLWWCFGVVLGLAVPGRVRDMRGRVGWGGGAPVCGPACLPSAPSTVSSSAFPLPLAFCLFVLLCPFFFGSGVAGVRLFLCWAWVLVRADAAVGV